MAGGQMVTNEDVANDIDTVIADPKTKMIILNVAFCDFDGSVVDEDGHATASGKYAERLKTMNGQQTLRLTPSEKIIKRIRKDRKDIFLVAFKTTVDATDKEQYLAGLNLLKANSANLVLANDLTTRRNIVITPEESFYGETTDRHAALTTLLDIALARSKNTFTRSTVVDAPPVDWMSSNVPENLRAVVDHCIKRGAYKPFRNATVGHFAVRLTENSIITSRRKHDFNRLREDGMIEVEYEGLDKVVAKGGKPSVGGQSQRIIFDSHPDLDCIVHFHCPIKKDAVDNIPVALQWFNECGSINCGLNTSDNLEPVRGRSDMKVVMLDNHGPNIVFNRNTPAEDVIEFIEQNFDLEDKTGGLVS